MVIQTYLLSLFMPGSSGSKVVYYMGKVVILLEQSEALYLS
jgi:hypothetical protein